MKIEVQPNAEAAAKAGAKFIANLARETITERGQFVMAVSGGQVPWRMFRLLADEPLQWHVIHLVQVDERVAPAGDTDRNLTHLHASLLAHTSLPLHNIHAMPVEDKNLEAAAQNYSRMLQQIAGSPPALDLVHLGMGPDGHTASLVPGDPVLGVNDKDVALTGIYQKHQRMTLTYPLLNRARQILWLICGAEKTGAFKSLVDGDPSIPASRIRQDTATVLVDLAAAGNTRVEAKKT